MDQILYPTPEDILRLNDQIPEWFISSEDFLTHSQDREQFFTPFEINAWVRMIGQRIKDADYSFIMASFYLEKGIPDEEWYAASNSGIVYFPNFNEQHNRNKFAFDFYSDAYFYKVFSALDAIAHLMTIVLPLTWDEKENISFFQTVRKFKRLKPELHRDLRLIMNQPEYKKINRLRNDSTHNFSDSHVTSGVIREANQTKLTIGNYMTVKDKHFLMQWMCNKLIQIVNLIKTKWKS